MDQEENYEDENDDRFDETEERERALTDLLMDIEAWDLDAEYSDKADKLWEDYFDEVDGAIDRLNEHIEEYEKKAAAFMAEQHKKGTSVDSYVKALSGSSSSSGGSGGSKGVLKLSKLGCVVPILFFMAIPTIIICMETGHTSIGVAVFFTIFVLSFVFFGIAAARSKRMNSSPLDPKKYTYTYGKVSECKLSYTVTVNGVARDTYKVKAQTDDGKIVTANACRSYVIGDRISLAVKNGTLKAQIVDDCDSAETLSVETKAPERLRESGSFEIVDMEDKLVAELKARGQSEFVNRYYESVNDIWDEYRGFDDDKDMKVLARIKSKIELFERLYLYNTDKLESEEKASLDSGVKLPEDTKDEDKTVKQTVAPSLDESIKTPPYAPQKIEEIEKPEPVTATADIVAPYRIAPTDDAPVSTPTVEKLQKTTVAPATARASASGAGKTVGAPSLAKRQPSKPANADESAVADESDKEPSAAIPTESNGAKPDSVDKSKRVIGYKSIKKR